MHRVTKPASLVAALGVLVIAAYLLGAGSPVMDGAMYMTVALGGLATLVAGLRRHLSRLSSTWWAFLAGVGLLAGGDLVWTLDDAARIHVPWTHLSDALYLGSYPLFAYALIMFSASRKEPVETVLRQLVDTGLVFIAAFTAMWFLVLDPMLDRKHLPAGELALTLAYPTLDLLLLALAFRFAFTSGSWPLSYRLITAAFFSVFVGDITWRLALADGSYDVSSWINVLFMAGYVLWGVAAFHPSISRIDHFGFAAEYAGPRPAWRRLTLVGVASCVPPIVLMVGRQRIDDRTDVIVFSVVLVLLPLLGVIRVADMLRSLQRVLGERDQMINASPLPIAVVDRDGIVHVWNPAAEQASGFAAADVLGSRAPIMPAEGQDDAALLYSEAIQGVPHERVDVKVRNKTGEPIDVRVSTAPLLTDDGRVVVLFEDVTRERAQEAEIAFLANHDPLTGLPNRRGFETGLAEATARAAGVVHLALFDVDDFKSLNDTGGHAIGDEILRKLALLLRQSVREEGALARLSGDEFALIVEGVEAGEAMLIVERLLGAARDLRVEVDSTVFDVSLSAGLYSMSQGDAPELALRRADEALYRAKTNGKNRAESWAGRSADVIGVARLWSPRIKDALRDDRLDLFLQPIVSLADEEPRFYEALCRLRSEDGSIIPAMDWIEHAEQVGLMPAIDLRMIEKAEELLCSVADLRLFVNVSPTSFLDGSVLRRFEVALERVPTGSLGIEVTEHTALADLGRAAETLSRFQTRGALVAIDDFGLGFTSFAELATLPCDIVKIPGSFTTGAGAASHTAAIAGAITKIAHHFGKAVVIEGVESGASARRAKLTGIEYAQGWHYGRPAASEAWDRPYRTGVCVAR